MSNQQSLLSDDARITDVDIADRMEQSFLDYSMSVIVGRALPDVRDGLKPVQRRILYAMWEAGLRPDRPHRKCASAVGDVMKKYHPHGDSSIYEALVRMAQDFSSRAPLIDGHGNFGSVDGDPAAAMRYTEARLSPLAMVLLDGIDEDTVELIANYDGFEHEPVVLPARFPNLLVNGASGIAVGMATNIPPHNLREVVRACQELLVRPEATVDELMRLLPAPDFPTGARIMDTPGIRDAYLTGRGAITMEAVASTETRAGGLPRIIVTEIPYQVNKATLLEKLAELVKARKLEEIRDLRDESSRDGMRVVIELKRGEDPARVLARLYALSDLRTNFNANMVALVDGQPRTIGLVEALTAYLAHQRDVLTRRTTYRRERAAARAHVLEGLLVALDHLDEVIALIRAADSADVARTQLISRFTLTEVQATAILDMMLRRLAALERQRIAEEHAQLQALIAELDAILADPAKLDTLLSEELATVADDHGDARRSRLIGGGRAQKGTVREGRTPADATPGQASIRGRGSRGDPGGVTGELVAGQALPDLAAQPVTVYVTVGGVLKSVSQQRTSKPQGTARDPLVAVLRATTDDVLLLIDADGGGYRVGVGDVPVTTLRQRGTALAQLLGDGADAPLIGAVVLSGGLTHVLTASVRGLVKRTERAEFEGRARAMIAAGARDDDRLVAAVGVRPDDDLLLASRDGQVIRFHLADVRPMGRAAAGVSGLTLPAHAELVAASAVPAGEDGEREVVVVAADGAAKRSALAEFPTQGRGGKGVTAGTSALAWCGLAADLHLVSDGHPTVVRPTQLPAGRRGAPPAAGVLPGAIEAPVVAETASAAP